MDAVLSQQVPAPSSASAPPAAEPDRTVWRVLSCARAAGVEVSTEQLARVVLGCSVAELAAARERAAAAIDLQEIASPPADLLAGPSVTLDEALSLGLV